MPTSALLRRNDNAYRVMGAQSSIRVSVYLGLSVLLFLGHATAARAALVWGGGTDDWNNALPNFTGAAWIDGGDAQFAGGVPMAVKVDSSAGAVNVGSIAFTAAGYTIDGNTPTDKLTLVGAATIDAASDAAMSVILDGGAGLKKLGAGNLTLGAANVYTGPTDIAAGTLTLAGAGKLSSAGSAVTLRPNATLVLDNTATHVDDRLGGASTTMTALGGTLKYLPGADAAIPYTESIGTLALAGGTTKIETAQAAAGNTATFTIGAIDRTGRGTVLFTGEGLGTARNTIALPSVAPAANGIIPWAIATTGGGTPTYNLVKLNGTSVEPVTTYNTSPNTSSSGMALGWLADQDVRPAYDVTAFDVPGSTVHLNSLTLDSGIDFMAPVADYTLNFGTAGGAATILQTGATSADASVLNTDGVKQYILAFGSNEAVFHVMGNLTLLRYNTNILTGSGGGGLTKSGPGVLQLGSDAYPDFRQSLTGAVRYNEGTIEVFTNDNTGLSSFNGHQFNGGNLTLHITGARSFGDPVTVNADATITNDRRPGSSGAGVTATFGALTIGSQTLTIAGGDNVTSGTGGITFGVPTFTGNPTFIVANSPSGGTTSLTLGALNDADSTRVVTVKGTGNLTLSAAATAFSGVLAVDGGILKLGGAGRLGTGAASLTNGGTLLTSAAFTLGATESIRLGSGGGKIDTTGGNLTLATAGQLSGTGALTKIGTNSLIISAPMNGFSGAVTLAAGNLQLADATAYVGAAAMQPLLPNSNLTLTGGTLQLRANGQNNSTTQILTFSNPIAVTGPATINIDRQASTGGSAKTIALDTLSLANTTLTVTNGNSFALRVRELTLTGDATISNTPTVTVDSILGAYALTKSGSGTLSLTGTNAHTATTITAGTLNATVANALGSGAVTLAGGTLRAGASGSVAYPNVVKVSAAGATSKILVGDNFSGIWGGAAAVKQLGTLSLDPFSKVTLDSVGSTYNNSSGIGGTLVFANTVLSDDGFGNASAEIATTGNYAAFVKLGTVTGVPGSSILTLSGTTKWTFLMDAPSQFAGIASVTLSGTALEVTAPNANLGNVNVSSASAILRLSAAQDTGTVPTAPIAGILDINTNIGTGFAAKLAYDSGITSTSALAATPVPVTFGSNLTLQGKTSVTAGGITLAGNLSNETTYSGLLSMTGKGILVLSGNNSGLGTAGSNAITVGTTTNGGVVQFANANALPAGLVMADMYGAVSFAYDGPTAVPASITGSGAFAVDAVNTQPLDFTGSTLRLSSAVAGSVSGPITPNTNYRLGGAGGTLTVNSTLTDLPGSIAVGLDMNSVNAASALPAGRVILAAANGYTGATEINSGALQLAHVNAAAGTSAINLNGSVGPTVTAGELLLDPTIAYPTATLAKIQRNGGVVGWTTPKTLAMAADLPGVYYGARVLGLGGEYSADIKVNFPITDGGGAAVTLRKTGPAVLDLTGSGAGTYTGGTEIVGGEIKVANGSELGSGTLWVGYGKGAAIRFTADASLANPLVVATAGWEGNGGFAVDAGKTATLTGNLVVGNRGCITKTGAGTLQLLFATPTGADNRWGLDAVEGTLETNRMPDQAGVSGSSVTGNGQLIFRGGRLHFTAGGPTTIATSDFLGFGALVVTAGTSSVVDVDAGADLKTHGHNGNWLHGELTKVGPGTFQMATLGGGGALFAFGNGTLNLREGTIVAGGGRTSNSGQNKAFSDYGGFTLKLQDGAKMVFTQSSDGLASVINGRLRINDEYAGAGTPVATVAGYKSDITVTGNKYGYNEATGAISLQTAGAGATDWTGTLEVLFGTANLNRNAGAPVTLSATVPAVLKIDAGATVNVGGTGDILTDSTTPTRHVSVQNDGLFNVVYNNGPTGNVKTAAAVVGAGDLNIASGTTLVTEVVRQDTVTINVGGKLKIETAGGPAGTSVVNFLSIANASGSFAWGDGAGSAPTGAGGASVTPVPEPATWLLLLAAAAGLLAWRRRR